MTEEMKNVNELKSEVLKKPDDGLSDYEKAVLNKIGKDEYRNMYNDIEKHVFDLKDTSGTKIEKVKLKDLVENMDTNVNLSTVNGKKFKINWGSELGAWIQIYLVSHPKLSINLTTQSKAEYLGIDGKIGEKTKMALNELRNDVLDKKQREEFTRQYPYIAKDAPGQSEKTFQTQKFSHFDNKFTPKKETLPKASDKVTANIIGGTGKKNLPVEKPLNILDTYKPEENFQAVRDSAPRVISDIKNKNTLQSALDAQKDSVEYFNTIAETIKKTPKYGPVNNLSNGQAKTKMEQIKPRGPEGIKINIDLSRDQKLDVKTKKIALEEKISEEVVPNKAEFIQKVVEVANNLKINPAWLMNIINIETAGTFDHREPGTASQSYGLVQFMPDTIDGLLRREEQYDNIHIDVLLREEYPEFPLEYVNSLFSKKNREINKKYKGNEFSHLSYEEKERLKEEEKAPLREKEKLKLQQKYMGMDFDTVAKIKVRIKKNPEIYVDFLEILRKRKRVEFFKKFSNMEQLDYVQKYYKGQIGRKKINTFSDLYKITLYPEAYGKDRDYVLGSGRKKDDIKAIASQNLSVNLNKDELLTAGEVEDFANLKYRG